jgi:hypothetical protein
MSRETLDPPGAMPSRDTVLFERGSEPIHEGQAIVDALKRLLSPLARKWSASLPHAPPSPSHLSSAEGGRRSDGRSGARA